MDNVWAMMMVAFLLGAAYTLAWTKLRALWAEWLRVWREERGMKERVEAGRAKLAERRR